MIKTTRQANLQTNRYTKLMIICKYVWCWLTFQKYWTAGEPRKCLYTPVTTKWWWRRWC